MSISPTITQSTACARPYASWSMMAGTELGVADRTIADSVFLGHLGFSSNGTTGSKRLSPGSLEEVST